MNVLAYDPFVPAEKFHELGLERADSPDKIYREADFITVHLPKNAETLGFISDDEFAKMKDGVRVINVARGGIIDEDALARAIESGKVAASAVDVYPKEPTTETSFFKYDSVVAHAAPRRQHRGGAAARRDAAKSSSPSTDSSLCLSWSAAARRRFSTRNLAPVFLRTPPLRALRLLLLNSYTLLLLPLLSSYHHPPFVCPCRVPQVPVLCLGLGFLFHRRIRSASPRAGHPDRSDPTFSSAPNCGPSGRVLEGSWHPSPRHTPGPRFPHPFTHSGFYS